MSDVSHGRNGRGGFASSGTGHAGMFGPTTGDRMRLADTELILQVEADRTVSGDEVKFGGGKVIRDGMGQDARASRAAGAPDLVITNALVVDYTGIFKADIAVRDGLIAGIGKAGNPGLQDGVDAALVIGPGTEVVAGEGMICTAGAIDSHIHFICPQLIETALTSGVTTLLGGGHRPGARHPGHHLHAGGVEPGPHAGGRRGVPGQPGLLRQRANSSLPEPLREQVAAGACGLKLHEDWGNHAGGDRLLSRRGRRERRAGGDPHRHPERSRFRGRHHPRVPRAHHPHLPLGGRRRRPRTRHPARVRRGQRAAEFPPTPTRPFTVNTVAEHRDMLMVCHHLDPAIPGGMSRSPTAGSGRRPSPPRTFCTTLARSASWPATARRWGASAR